VNPHLRALRGEDEGEVVGPLLEGGDGCKERHEAHVEGAEGPGRALAEELAAEDREDEHEYHANELLARARGRVSVCLRVGGRGACGRGGTRLGGRGRKMSMQTGQMRTCVGVRGRRFSWACVATGACANPVRGRASMVYCSTHKICI
jgi:hypothetical protein